MTENKSEMINKKLIELNKTLDDHYKKTHEEMSEFMLKQRDFEIYKDKYLKSKRAHFKEEKKINKQIFKLQMEQHDYASPLLREYFTKILPKTYSSIELENIKKQIIVFIIKDIIENNTNIYTYDVFEDINETIHCDDRLVELNKLTGTKYSWDYILDVGQHTFMSQARYIKIYDDKSFDHYCDDLVNYWFERELEKLDEEIVDYDKGIPITHLLLFGLGPGLFKGHKSISAIRFQ